MPEFEQSRIDAAYAHLDSVDEVFRSQRFGWNQDHGTYEYGGNLFDELVKEITYQGISGASADAAYAKLRQSCRVSEEDPIRPEDILNATSDQLSTPTTGLTTNKIRSLRDLASRVASGDLDLSLDHLDSCSDEELERQLGSVFGVGPGTVNHYRRYTLGHLDVINPANKKIQRGLQLAYSLKVLPSTEQAESMMAKWIPYRAIGQWHMWKLGNEDRG